jgi:hypothetical protein
MFKHRQHQFTKSQVNRGRIGVEFAEMASSVHKFAASLALGLSAMALAQGPVKGPPAVAGDRVMRSSGKMATSGPPQSTKPAEAAKPSAVQPPAQVQTPAQTEAPQQPVYPPRPEQMAPVAPLVTYQNGQLSIVAQNATLSSILSAVKTRTGAQLDMPADAANDRVAAQLGPGNPRDVIASLLQGSRFDYIVLGSVDDPNLLSQIVLTTRRGGSGAGTAVAGGGPSSSGGSSAQTAPFRGGVSRPEINAEEEEAEPPPPPEPEPVPAAENPQPQPGVYQPGAPGMNVPGGNPQGAVPGQANPQQPGQVPGQPGQVRTPEQLLQELQRMQQQQQQQQQQQRPPQ